MKQTTITLCLLCLLISNAVEVAAIKINPRSFSPQKIEKGGTVTIIQTKISVQIEADDHSITACYLEDKAGKTIISQTNCSGSPQFELSTEALPPGQYQLRVHAGNNVFYFIVEISD